METREKSGNRKSLMKKTALNFSYALACGLAVTYGVFGLSTGELNPQKQYQSMYQSMELSEDRMKLKRRIDSNNNRNYSVQELSDFCDNVGINPLEMNSTFSVNELSREEVDEYNTLMQE